MKKEEKGNTVNNNNPQAVERQHAKNVVSYSPRLLDFAIGQVNSVFNLPNGQVKICRRFKNYRSTVRQNV